MSPKVRSMVQESRSLLLRFPKGTKALWSWFSAETLTAETPGAGNRSPRCFPHKPGMERGRHLSPLPKMARGRCSPRGNVIIRDGTFLASHDQINTIFRPRRDRLSTISYRHARADAFDLWDGYAAEMTA